MVGQAALNRSIVVRLPVSQPAGTARSVCWPSLLQDCRESVHAAAASASILRDIVIFRVIPQHVSETCVALQGADRGEVAIALDQLE
jgi:hypothetical protein